MDYEKAYKEALERASKLQENSNGMILKKLLWNIFPELKESEDERMLREIKRYIKEQGDKPTGLPNGTVAISDMIAWLEKQGEKKPVEENKGNIWGISSNWSEEELTEFEKMLRYVLECYSDHEFETKPEIEALKLNAKSLLDLARNEIRKEEQEKLGTLEMPIDPLNPYYQKGRENALKSIPKWKKAEKDEELDCHVAIQQDGRVVLSDFVQKDEYYITLDVLKTLPKEE